MLNWGAALIAGLIGAVYVAGLYLFFAHVWPRLPPFVAMLIFIVLTLLAVLSPLFALLRLGSFGGHGKGGNGQGKS